MTEQRLKEIEAIVSAGQQFETDYYGYGGPDCTSPEGYRRRLFEMTKVAGELLKELRISPRSSVG